VLVFGEGTPHTAIDAVAEAGDIGDSGPFGSGSEGGEDEFWRGELRDVGFEG